MAAVVKPSARPVFSGGTFFCTSVMSGPLNQAHAMAMTAHSTANAGNICGVSSPQTDVVAPTISAATAMSPARRLPPPQAMRMTEPMIMPMPKVASTSDAMYPSPLKWS